MDVASHTALMEPILPDICGRRWPICTPATPTIPFLSTVTEPVPRRCWTPTTGWPTCASRCGSARPSPRPAAEHAHVRRDQPAPDAGARRSARRWQTNPPPQRRHAGARQLTTREVPHQPEHHPHHPPAADRAPRRAAHRTAHHAVAPHPALDRRPARCAGTVARDGSRCAADGTVPVTRRVVLRDGVAGQGLVAPPDAVTSGAHSWLVDRRRRTGAEIGRLLGDSGGAAVHRRCRRGGGGEGADAVVEALATRQHVLYAPGAQRRAVPQPATSSSTREKTQSLGACRIGRRRRNCSC